MIPLIQIQRLSRVFKHKVVLKEISFSAEKNETIHLKGKNGAGKSTLFRILSTLLLPTGGELFYSGEPLVENQIKFRGKIIYVPSEENVFFPRLTGRQNILTLGRFYSMNAAHTETKLNELENFFSLNEALNTPYGQCSSGMKQKLKLAMAYVRDGDILLLDEPLQSLDRESQEQARKVLKKISQERLCIYTDHTGDTLESITTRRLQLVQGVLV